MFGGRFVYKVECTVGATVGGVARGSGPTPGSPHAGAAGGCRAGGRAREPCARVGHARRSGCPSRQLAGNSGALCCPVQSLLLYILTPYRETAVLARIPYRVRLYVYLAYMELLKETALEEACHPRAAITLEVRLGVRLRHVCVLA